MDMTPILACERTKRSRDVATGKLPETLTITSGFVDGTVIGAVVAEQVHSRKPWRRLVFAAAASALASVAGLALCLPNGDTGELEGELEGAPPPVSGTACSQKNAMQDITSGSLQCTRLEHCTRQRQSQLGAGL